MKDYFTYLPQQTGNSIWGCVTTGVGFTHVLPNQPYPPRQHPLAHHFHWNEGRVLQSYQIILISSGHGVFESASGPGIQTVEAGTVMVLFPGVWHRYRPSPETGWVEHWIECLGPAFDAAARAGLVRPEHGLLTTGSIHDLSDCFERCHNLARVDAVAHQDLLSTLGLHLLALLGYLRRGERGFTKSIDQVVQRAHTLIALRCQEPLNLRGLAAELGVGYSNLRHSFFCRVGISLRQHYLNMRVQKAQDFLLNTSKSVKEIAEILGFDSPSHFSKQFKQRVGSPPDTWRRRFGAAQRFSRSARSGGH